MGSVWSGGGRRSGGMGGRTSPLRALRTGETVELDARPTVEIVKLRNFSVGCFA